MNKKTKLKKWAEYSLEVQLESMEKQKLVELFSSLMKQNADLRRQVLEWIKTNERCSGKIKISQRTLDDELLFEYWNKASVIISEANEYGGYHYHEGNEVFDWLSDISKLIEKGNFSDEVKREFMDEVFIEYDHGNSGFDDDLMDLLFKICKDKKDWHYLIELLERKPSEWRISIIIQILKDHLHDENGYLQLRLKTLKTGSDYWDLVNFYHKKNKLKEALENAEKGIKHGEGRLTELLEFLFSHYAAIKDTLNLERIVKAALKKKSDEKSLLDKLFEYYKKEKNYEMAKGALIESQKYVRYDSYFHEYKRLNKFLNESDFKEIETSWLEKVKKESTHDYIEICLYKNLKSEALQALLKSVKIRNRFLEDNLDGFAEKLKSDYPKEIIDYYWKIALDFILQKKRNSYSSAVCYLKNVKSIYLNILKDPPTWKNRISTLRTEFKICRAFIELSQGL
ncbi:MAG: hypothetical protein KKG79_02805 [Acidobacteria bacterium]|nr:hypothetical protein [Acidobacteriota bacterium]